MVTDDFVTFLKDCIAQVQKPADLDVFANFLNPLWAFTGNMNRRKQK